MKQSRIDAIKELWQHARPGPWEALHEGHHPPYTYWGDTDPFVCMKRNDRGYSEDDSTLLDVPTAQAIAAAPTDIADLIAEVERLHRILVLMGTPRYGTTLPSLRAYARQVIEE